MSQWWSTVALGVLLGALLACSGVADIGGAESVEWPDGTTWTCGGSDVKTLKGISKAVEGKDLIAVEAAGNCQLTIEDCDISADFALKATGNAKVTVKGGRLHGNVQSIQAWGNAVVTYQGTVVHGETATTGNGKIEELPAQ